MHQKNLQMNTERLQNLYALIRENLAYLVRKTSLAIMTLVLIFSVVIAVLFLLSGKPFHTNWLLALFWGTAIALINLNLSYPLGFALIGKREIEAIDKPERLFDLYFGTGLVMALFMIIVPILGLVVSVLLFGTSASIYFLMGVSIVSFFSRLGGGIFSKGSDISSDLVSRSNPGIHSNDSRNASSIADKIGDHFNNGLALTLDLVESLMGMVIAVSIYLQDYLRQQVIAPSQYLSVLAYPFLILLGSVMISFFAGFVVLFLKRKTMLGQLLKPVHGIYLSLLLIIVFFLVFSHYYSLSVLENLGTLGLPTGIGPFVCLLSGLILAVITGIVTDYYTSDAHPPVRELLQFAEYNSSLTELNGLAVGMKTLYIPIIFAVFSFLVAFHISGFYGIIMVATGFIAIAPIIIASSLYAPFADQVNGVTKMELGDAPSRVGMEELNIAGNTLSALAKNYASMSALIVVFSLFIAFIKLAHLPYLSIPIFHPLIISALFVGGVLPFILSSTLIRALTYTVIMMFEESTRQLQAVPYLIERKTFPDMRHFIRISGVTIVRDLVYPSLFVLVIPIAIGHFLGLETLSAVFIGIMISGTFLSMTFTNAGAALDNAKKMIEKGYAGGRGTQTYEHTISGDLFGDALKDLAGPVLNHFIKVMIVVSMVILPIITN